jgi:hypothetical protein
MSNSTNTAQTAADVTFEPFSDIVDNYRNGDKGDKARIRAEVNANMKKALKSGNFAEAAKWGATDNLLTTDKVDKPVDHAQNAANALFVINTLNAALVAYQTEHNITDIPVMSPDSDNQPLRDKADKLFKSVVSDRAPKSDIQDVFDKAFENTATGATMKVSDICRKGDKPGGSGAVAARLTYRANGTMHLNSDECTLDGYEPVWVDESGKGYVGAKKSESHRLGARKTA